MSVYNTLIFCTKLWLATGYYPVNGGEASLAGVLRPEFILKGSVLQFIERENLWTWFTAVCDINERLKGCPEAAKEAAWGKITVDLANLEKNESSGAQGEGLVGKAINYLRSYAAPEPSPVIAAPVGVSLLDSYTQVLKSPSIMRNVAFLTSVIRLYLTDIVDSNIYKGVTSLAHARNFFETMIGNPVLLNDFTGQFTSVLDDKLGGEFLGASMLYWLAATLAGQAILNKLFTQESVAAEAVNTTNFKGFLAALCHQRSAAAGTYEGTHEGASALYWLASTKEGQQIVTQFFTQENFVKQAANSEGFRAALCRQRGTAAGIQKGSSALYWLVITESGQQILSQLFAQEDFVTWAINSEVLRSALHAKVTRQLPSGALLSESVSACITDQDSSHAKALQQKLEACGLLTAPEQTVARTHKGPLANGSRVVASASSSSTSSSNNPSGSNIFCTSTMFPLSLAHNLGHSHSPRGKRRGQQSSASNKQNLAPHLLNRTDVAATMRDNEGVEALLRLSAMPN